VPRLTERTETAGQNNDWVLKTFNTNKEELYASMDRQLERLQSDMIATIRKQKELRNKLSSLEESIENTTKKEQ
jgi:hypothetical protein